MFVSTSGLGVVDLLQSLLRGENEKHGQQRTVHAEEDCVCKLKAQFRYFTHSDEYLTGWHARVTALVLVISGAPVK